jgi:predicted dienelactone hydrolase
MPSPSLPDERDVDHHDGVLLDDADQHQDADQRDDREVDVRQAASATSARTPPPAGRSGWSAGG